MARFKSLKDVLLHYVPDIKVSGEELVAKCPFHKETKPSFSINTRTGLWGCFGCGARGTVKTLVERLTGDYILACILTDGLDFEQDIDDSPDGLTPLLPSNNGVSHYLSFRGFKIETLRYFEIFYNTEAGVVIPVRDELGKFVGWVERRLFGDSTYKYSKGLPRKSLLFNLHNVLRENYNSVYVCEGSLDCMWIHQAGRRNVVATLGACVSSEQLELLRRFFYDVVVVPDNDAAGLKMVAIIKSCPVLNVSVITPPIEGSDIQDYDEKDVLSILSGNRSKWR